LYPDIISIGELLVEIMRAERDINHGIIGEIYKGPYPSGAPAIFIDSVARLSKDFGIKAGLIGVIGDDEFGNSIVNKLNNDGVDITRIRRSNLKHTGIAFNQYNSDGSRKFIFAAGVAGDTSPQDLDDTFFQNIKVLHIMGSSLSISESSQKACYKAIRLAKKMNAEVIISFDPNLRSEMQDLEMILKISQPVLEKADILLPSGEEAEMLSGIQGEEEACLALLNTHLKMVVLKQGKRGSTLFTKKNQAALHVPSFKVNEIDPTGAGDSFDGAFIMGYLQGWDNQKILRFANAVGALKVQNFGPMPNTSYKEAISLINA
jgi:sugar/nucleoside kinase (ribokinase family)